MMPAGFAEKYSLRGGRRATEPRSRFLKVEARIGSHLGLKPKPDLTAVSRPSNKGPESSAQAVGSGPFALAQAPRVSACAQGAYSYYD